MSSEGEKTYEVGYGKPPIAGRIKKGERRNPAGRPKKARPELDPGKVLQQIDNEERMITIDGKRVTMRQAEINFRQLFGKALQGDLPTARIIAKMAAQYFGPEAQARGEMRVIVMPNDNPPSGSSKPRSKSRTPRHLTKQSEAQVSVGVMFRKVARDEILDGSKRTKIPYWTAYVRKIYEMALNNNTSAARLLEQLRRQFPGDLLPGDPIFLLISADDAMV